MITAKILWLIATGNTIAATCYLFVLASLMGGVR